MNDKQWKERILKEVDYASENLGNDALLAQTVDNIFDDMKEYARSVVPGKKSACAILKSKKHFPLSWLTYAVKGFNLCRQQILEKIGE